MNGLKEMLKKVKAWQLAVFFVALVGLIALVVVLNTSSDKYKVLYSELNKDDSRAIMTELGLMGVDYTTQNMGSQILVLSNKVSETRMKLATLGLPSAGNPGLDRLENSQLGETKYDKEKRFERALKEQIENDLVQGFHGIDSAKLALTLQEADRLFESSGQSKATVSLNLRQGVKLSESQVQGIQNYISGNIKNIETLDVVVLDEKGSILSQNAQGFGGSVNGGFSKQMQIVSETEGRIKNDIMQSLSTIFGYEHVRVNVRADINFDEIVRNIEKYDPEGTLVSSHRKNEETIKTDPAPDYEPGTDTNGDVPDYELEDINGNTVYQNATEEVIENFEVGKTVETIKKNPELSNLSVVAWIDKMMSDEDVQRMERAIATAAGVKDLDNDGVFDTGTVQVVPVIFNQNTQNVPEDDIKQGKEQGDLLANNKKMTVWIYILIGGAFVLLSLFAILNTRKKGFDQHEFSSSENKVKLSDEQESAENEEGSSDVSGASSEDLMDGLSSNSHNAEGLYEQDEKTERQRILTEEATRTAEENPERTADYLKKLINEG